jgi:hypothetical protein
MNRRRSLHPLLVLSIFILFLESEQNTTHLTECRILQSPKCGGRVGGKLSLIEGCPTGCMRPDRGHRMNVVKLYTKKLLYRA